MEERLLVEDFDDWLMEMRPDGAGLLEVSQILMSIFARMRFVQTFPELGATVSGVLNWTEKAIQDDANELDPETGDEKPRVLAEHWRDIEGGYEMAMSTHEKVTDEDIQKWLDEQVE